VDTALPRVDIVSSPDTDDGARRRESIAKAVYGREELDRQGDIDITDVLKRLPGVSMDSGAPRLRGLGGGYTQVLINGEPAPPGFSLDSLAPGDVERIEVIKGSTAEYSGVAGTINVVLREAPKTLVRELRSQANYRAVQPGGSLSYQWGDTVDALSFVLPVNLSRSAQGTSFDSERTSRTPLGEVRSQSIAGRDEGRSGNLQFAPRLQWKINGTDTLHVSGFLQGSAGVSDSARDIEDLMGSPSWTTQDQSQTRSDSRVQRAQMQWQRKHKEGGKVELKSLWQTTTRHTLGDYQGWQRDGASSLQRHSDTVFEETRATVGTRWSQPLGDAHSLLLGLDVESRQRDELRRVWDNGVERVGGGDGLPFSARIARAAVFFQDEWAISERWSMLPGLRLEEVQTRSASTASSLEPEVDNAARLVAPILHINFRLDPKGKDQLRASVTRSFKLPDLGALLGRYIVNTTYESNVSNTPIAPDRAGNPALRPELANGVDFAYEHYPANGGVLSVGFFHRRIEGLIRQRITLESLAQTGVQRWVSRPDNFGVAHSNGLEIEIKGRAEDWLPAWFTQGSGVQLRSAWNVYRSEVEQVDGPDNRLEAQPPWSANMGFDARIKNTGWTVGASLILQPAYSTQQTDRQSVQRSGLRTLDAFVSWRADRSMQWRLGVSNLLAPQTVTSNAVQDIDGFSAGSTSRRQGLRSINVAWIWRL
jgi:iron complex outermembrane receptor protein